LGWRARAWWGGGRVFSHKKKNVGGGYFCAQLLTLGERKEEGGIRKGEMKPLGKKENQLRRRLTSSGDKPKTKKRRFQGGKTEFRRRIQNGGGRGANIQNVGLTGVQGSRCFMTGKTETWWCGQGSNKKKKGGVDSFYIGQGKCPIGVL